MRSRPLGNWGYARTVAENRVNERRYFIVRSSVWPYADGPFAGALSTLTKLKAMGSDNPWGRCVVGHTIDRDGVSLATRTGECCYLIECVGVRVRRMRIYFPQVDAGASPLEFVREL